jgi:hypothetical protein
MLTSIPYTVGVGDVLSVFDNRETPKELQSSFGVFLLPPAGVPH